MRFFYSYTFHMLIVVLVISIERATLVDSLSKSDDGADAKVLMAFKTSCVQSDPSGFLSTWTTNGSSNTSPCNWRGVICSSDDAADAKLHGIIALNLTNARIIGELHIDLLKSLSSLRQLHLSGNVFSFVPTKINPSSSSCNLDTIDLSNNNLSGPFQLSTCSSLTSLNLSRNSIIQEGGSTLTLPSSLRQLDLSRNGISDYHLFNYTLHNSPNLTYLNFSDNKLSGNLPPFNTNNHLSILDLSNNLFSGKIPPNIFLTATSLTYLDLSHNKLSGSFSDLEFGEECANLTVLNLSHNTLSFDNNFSSSTITNCQQLQSLDFSYNNNNSSSNNNNNNKNITIPRALGKLNRLQHLSLAKNQFTGDIPQELGLICGTLQHLDLSSNQLSGGLPSTFVSCASLQTLNLGNNQLSGDFLTTVVSTITSLRYLYVPFNNIIGSVPQSLISNCTQLQVLDLSSNVFTGNVPSWLCSHPSASSLQKILLAGNYLSGALPYQLGDCKTLKALVLSFNNLSGSIPRQVWDLPNLTDLVIWANSLNGEIPTTICANGGGQNLETLILNNNFITGTIPTSLATCTNLIWVSLSNNMLKGEIPVQFGNLNKLAVLQLGNNSLTGEIPWQLGNCQSLIWLDLNSNELTGTIPPQLSSQAGLITPGLVSGKQFAFVRNEGGTSCRGAGGLVEFEGIRTDRLTDFPMLHSCPSIRIYTGLTVYSYTANGSMIYLDLSYNSLLGAIPDTFGYMSYLQVLNLGHNTLTGSIPDSFGGLKEVGVLDLSHNDLQGFLPAALGTLSFLNDLDVSNNNLTGLIPSTGQLTTFPSSRYENNSGLCGVPLPPCGSGIGTRLTHNKSRGKKQSMATGVIIGIVLAFLFALGLTFVLYRMNKSQHKEEDRREKYIESLPTSGNSSWKLSGVLEPLSINIATFEKPLRKLTFAHLLEATNGFSSDSMIGSGGFGEVYKARLKDGCVVAIKKLIHVTGQGDREFTAEMETIGKIKHRNLVPLLGYCKIGDERLLVYEYMKWGSLEMVLHDRAAKGGGCSKLLDWAARKKIAIGSARGLAFLHHSCIPHIIHRDMKSSNVLLDENLEARVSDFGMARLMNALDTHLSVSTLAGTPGYVPPEYYQSFRCTTKGDVYSYGVILLELLSGKRPIEPSVFGDDNNLVGWAKQLQREKRCMEILDPELIQESGEAELHQYLKIAFQCLEDRPFRRPTMIQVMTMFKELQMDSSESDILDGFSLVKQTVMEDVREKDP